MHSLDNLRQKRKSFKIRLLRYDTERNRIPLKTVKERRHRNLVSQWVRRPVILLRQNIHLIHL